MKKKIIIAVSFVLVLAIVFVTLIFYDRSGLIIQAYNEYGYTVTEKILEETTLNYYLSDKQLEQAADYKIVYFRLPGGNITASGTILICPNSLDAIEFLKMSDNGLYEEMREKRKIKGNCILFTNNYSVIDTFNDYLYIVIIGLFN